jgi:hypothetical protein
MDNAGATRARGTIIKAPDSTPGLLYVQGQQKQFTLEGIWRSPVAPAPNMIVDVDLDASGNIVGLTAADQPQQSSAHTGQAGAAAAEQGKQAVEFAKKGIGAMAAKMGSLALGAAVLIVIAFFFFPAMSVGMMGISVMSYTFWNLTGADMGGMGGLTSSLGFWSLIGFLAIAAPFAAPFLKMAWAKYLNAAPLGFILLTMIKLWWSFHSAMGGANGMLGGAAPSFFDIFSIAWGFYILLLASLALASQAFMKPKSA